MAEVQQRRRNKQVNQQIDLVTQELKRVLLGMPEVRQIGDELVSLIAAWHSEGLHTIAEGRQRGEELAALVAQHSPALLHTYGPGLTEFLVWLAARHVIPLDELIAKYHIPKRYRLLPDNPIWFDDQGRAVVPPGTSTKHHEQLTEWDKAAQPKGRPKGPDPKTLEQARRAAELKGEGRPYKQIAFDLWRIPEDEYHEGTRRQIVRLLQVWKKHGGTRKQP